MSFCEPGLLGDRKDYQSHAYEIISCKIKPKPASPGVSSIGGIRIIFRGHKPIKVELLDRVLDKVIR